MSAKLTIILRFTVVVKRVSFVLDSLKMAPKGWNMEGHINIEVFILNWGMR
jgi:hypothetical protein